MSKTLFGLLAGLLIGFVIGAFSMGERPGITLKPIKSNTVKRDYSVIRPVDIEDLKCYDTADPFLDISPLGGENYSLSAGLCRRKWSREVSISRPAKKNAVFMGLAYSLPSGPGAQFLYFRRFGGLFLGGGLTVYQNSAGIQAGGMVQF